MLLNSRLSFHDVSSCGQQALKILLCDCQVRVSFLLRNTPDDLVVLKGRCTVTEGQIVEDGITLLAIVKLLKSLDIAIKQFLVDVCLSLANLLKNSIELVHHLDVTILDCLCLIKAAFVERLELATLSHASD